MKIGNVTEKEALVKSSYGKDRLEQNAEKTQQEKEKIHERVMQGLDSARKKGKKLGRPPTGVPREFIREYKKLQSGEYGSISVVQFAKLQGIAVSTFYKYAGILKEEL